MAPARRNESILLRVVVPRTTESSTTISRLSVTLPRIGLSFSRTVRSRMVCVGWMNERPTLVVGGEAAPHRHAGLFVIAHRRTAGAVRHGNDEVRVGGRLAGEDASHLLAGQVDVPAEDLAGRVGEVDVLEDAMRGADVRRLDEAPRAHALLRSV